uniref:Uncharacterized protein n=1 Tax=Auxenochlorella protothecoides TaxID=3075 RepID=A0A1D2A8S5_AUXPR
MGRRGCSTCALLPSDGTCALSTAHARKPLSEKVLTHFLIPKTPPTFVHQVADFVSCYMPAYRLYLPSLYKDGPTTARKGHTLVVEIDQSRVPITDLSGLLPDA